MAELVALLDIGSTAARFLLARVVPGARYRVLRQERIPTRLGGGAGRRLPRKAVKATLRGIRRFLREVRKDAPRVVAVATAAVRDAGNRERLLGPLRRDDGIEVEILSAREEARLGAFAALRSLPVSDATIMDLGGASLQLTRVRRGEIAASASVPLGAVRMTRAFLRHDPPTGRELQALRTEIRAQLAGVLAPALRDAPLVAMGGTVRTLAAIHLRGRRGKRGDRRQGLRLLPSDVTAIRERLETRPRRKRRKMRGLRAERADIIVAGVIVIEEVMTFGGFRSLVVSTEGVRDGLLLRETFGGRF